MRSKVFTLTETTGETGFVLGVFADKALALDAARSWANHRLRRCQQQDEATFGHRPAEGTYAVVETEQGEHVELSIVHAASGEADSLAWQIRPFDVARRKRVAHAEAASPSAQAA